VVAVVAEEASARASDERNAVAASRHGQMSQ